MSTNDEPIQYNPYSLYYIHAINEGEIVQKAADNTVCNNISDEDDEAILEKCLSNAYYNNQQKAIDYVESSNKQSSTQQNYEDVKLDYNEELMNSMNLLLGSLVLGGLIYKHVFSY